MVGKDLREGAEGICLGYLGRGIDFRVGSWYCHVVTNLRCETGSEGLSPDEEPVFVCQ
jgi:hypothetical protein